MFYLGGGNQMMNMNQNPGAVNATTCEYFNYWSKLNSWSNIW